MNIDAVEGDKRRWAGVVCTPGDRAVTFAPCTQAQSLMRKCDDVLQRAR